MKTAWEKYTSRGYIIILCIGKFCMKQSKRVTGVNYWVLFLKENKPLLLLSNKGCKIEDKRSIIQSFLASNYSTQKSSGTDL